MGLSPAKVLKFARKYTSNVPTSVEVWLERLTAERRFSSSEDVEQAWSEARRSVEGTVDGVKSIWVWGLEQCTSDGMEEKRQIHKARRLTSQPYPFRS